jgi:hypothetical protein
MMPSKKLIMLGMVVGSIVGGYVPCLFGVSAISFTSLFTSTIGATLGIWLGYKFGRF